MANKKIKTVAFVHIGDKLVNIDDLNTEQKTQVATWLKTTYLNSLFQGKAKFYEQNVKA